MNSDPNVLVHLSTGPNVNSQQKLTGFVEVFTRIWWMIFVDMLAISVFERGFRVKVKLLYQLYA